MYTRSTSRYGVGVGSGVGGGNGGKAGDGVGVWGGLIHAVNMAPVLQGYLVQYLRGGGGGMQVERAFKKPAHVCFCATAQPSPPLPCSHPVAFMFFLW